MNEFWVSLCFALVVYLRSSTLWHCFLVLLWWVTQCRKQTEFFFCLLTIRFVRPVVRINMVQVEFGWFLAPLFIDFWLAVVVVIWWEKLCGFRSAYGIDVSYLSAFSTCCFFSRQFNYRCTKVLPHLLRSHWFSICVVDFCSAHCIGSVFFVSSMYQ